MLNSMPSLSRSLDNGDTVTVAPLKPGDGLEWVQHWKLQTTVIPTLRKSVTEYLLCFI